jgi:D-glycero-D-manno-heptose 1,7-bisphosphate phosphatase
MFFEAARYLNLDLGRSLLVGDKLSDILAARAAGLPRAIHVRTGHGADAAEEAKSLSAVSPGFEVIVAANAEAAIEKL